MTPILFFELKISILIAPFLIFIFIKGIPRPIKILNNGPAIEPDKAISPYPNLTKLKLSIKSEILFPYVKIVIPKNDWLIFINSEIVINNDNKILAENHIQINDIIKVKADKITG